MPNYGGLHDDDFNRALRSDPTLMEDEPTLKFQRTEIDDAFRRFEGAAMIDPTELNRKVTEHVANMNAKLGQDFMEVLTGTTSNAIHEPEPLTAAHIKALLGMMVDLAPRVRRITIVENKNMLVTRTRNRTWSERIFGWTDDGRWDPRVRYFNYTEPDTRVIKWYDQFHDCDVLVAHPSIAVRLREEFPNG